VPAAALAEPDRNTSKPVVLRWFRRADRAPFFCAAIWRDWEGDRGTKKAPNVGRHKLYSFLTTAPNCIVEPVHNKAMPVMLMTPADPCSEQREPTPHSRMTMEPPRRL
jgi:putative SOS response-associated peptidase YedK